MDKSAVSWNKDKIYFHHDEDDAREGMGFLTNGKGLLAVTRLARQSKALEEITA
jgi:hypothetical protein